MKRGSRKETVLLVAVIMNDVSPELLLSRYDGRVGVDDDDPVEKFHVADTNSKVNKWVPMLPVQQIPVRYNAVCV